jgi:hypothetical protein
MNLSDIEAFIAKIAAQVSADLDALAARLPEGAKPTLAEIRTLIGQAFASINADDLVALVKSEVEYAVVHGKGPITKSRADLA